MELWPAKSPSRLDDFKQVSTMFGKPTTSELSRKAGERKQLKALEKLAKSQKFASALGRQ